MSLLNKPMDFNNSVSDVTRLPTDNSGFRSTTSSNPMTHHINQQSNSPTGHYQPARESYPTSYDSQNITSITNQTLATPYSSGNQLAPSGITNYSSTNQLAPSGITNYSSTNQLAPSGITNYSSTNQLAPSGITNYSSTNQLAPSGITNYSSTNQLAPTNYSSTNQLAPTNYSSTNQLAPTNYYSTNQHVTNTYSSQQNLPVTTATAYGSGQLQQTATAYGSSQLQQFVQDSRTVTTSPVQHQRSAIADIVTEGRLMREQTRDITHLEQFHTVLSERIVEHEITIPKKITREDVMEKIIVVPEKIINEEIIQEHATVRERIIEVSTPIIQEKVVEVPEYQYVEKIIEVPETRIEEKIREVHRNDVQERIIEVPKIVQQEKVIEVPQIEYREYNVEKVVEVPEYREEIVRREVPITQYVDKPVAEYVTTQVPEHIQRKVPVAVELVSKYMWEIPRMRPRVRKVKVPLYVPHFIEVAVPRELYTASMQTAADDIRRRVALISQESAVSLCDLENLASDIKTTGFPNKLNYGDLPNQLRTLWQSGALNIPNSQPISRGVTGPATYSTPAYSTPAYTTPSYAPYSVQRSTLPVAPLTGLSSPVRQYSLDHPGSAGQPLRYPQNHPGASTLSPFVSRGPHRNYTQPQYM